MAAMTAATFFSYLGTAATVMTAAKGLMSSGNDTPQVVQASPAADAGAAADKSAQEAQQKKLATQRAARANSLLSQAGGMGDATNPLTQSGVAGGKLTLGA